MSGRPKAPVVPQASGLQSFDDFEMRLGDVMRGERATLGKSLLDVQRELKIKASYIAAIENADPTAFETPGFIAGYVRSYARYLGLDPEWAYKTFCAEGHFETAHGMSAAASGNRAPKFDPRKTEARDPFADPNASFVPKGEAFFSRIEPGAVGSVAVLVALIGMIGYGGWAVLQEVQKVQFVPVDQTPGVVANLDPVATRGFGTEEGESDSALVAPTVDAFDRLYRPQALEVPVLVSRDGPIANLDPRQNGALAGVAATPDRLPASLAARAPETGVFTAQPDAPAEMANLGVEAAEVPETRAPVSGREALAAISPKVVADAAPQVAIFGVRPTWVRVRLANGTVVHEKTLEPCETIAIPATEEPPILRVGESGSLYFLVNGQTYGPAGSSGAVTRNLALDAERLTQNFALADATRDGDLRTYLTARAEADLSGLPVDCAGR